MKVKVVINEQHKLMDEQRDILRRYFGHNWETYPVPRDGWTVRECEDKAEELSWHSGCIVFVSPVPVLLGKLAFLSAGLDMCAVYVFQNDKIAETGWELVPIE